MTGLEWLLGFVLAGFCLWIPLYLIHRLANELGPTESTGTTIDDYILRGGRKDDTNETM